MKSAAAIEVQFRHKTGKETEKHTMKRVIVFSLSALFSVALLGCGAASKTIVLKSQSEKADVFTEVTDAGARPQGFADLIVKANIKTHEAGYYVAESGERLHGKPGYPFVFNIDGQAAIWKIDGQKDVKPAYDEQGKTSKDPEARTGIKYVLEKKLRLRPGMRKIYFALPEEDYSVEAEITLREGEEAVLEFKPRYRRKTLPTRIPTFLQGIDKYEIYLNGVTVQKNT